MRQTSKETFLQHALAEARTAHGQGRHAAVMSLLEGGESLANASAREAAEAHGLLAQACFALARLDDAVRHGRLAAASCAAQGDREGESLARRTVAFAFTEAGAHDLAMAEARAALEAAEASGQELESLKLLVLMARLHERLGDFVGGEAILLHTLSRARDTSRRDMVAHASNALLALMVEAWEVHTQRGDHTLAHAAAERLQLWLSRFAAIEREQHDAMRQAVLRSNLGAAYLVCGRHSEAEQMLRRSLEVCASQGFELVAVRALLRLAWLAVRTGRIAEAALLAQQAGERLDQKPHPEAAEALLQLRTAVAQAHGDLAAAAQHAEACATLQRARLQRVEVWRERFQGEGVLFAQ